MLNLIAKKALELQLSDDPKIRQIGLTILEELSKNGMECASFDIGFLYWDSYKRSGDEKYKENSIFYFMKVKKEKTLLLLDRIDYPTDDLLVELNKHWA